MFYLLQEDREYIEMISTKAYELLVLLSNTKEYQSIESLSYQLKIKPRTLREIIRIYKDEIEKNGNCTLTIKNNYGYLLEIHNAQVFQTYLQEEKQKLHLAHFKNPETSSERADYIIRRLLLEKEPIKSDDLCDLLIISKSTLAQDLKLVRSILQKYSLTLEVQGKQGLFINGDHTSIRSCFADYFFHDISALSLLSIDTSLKDLIHKIIVFTLKHHHYQMSDIGIENLTVHILISLYMSRLYSHEVQKMENFDTQKYALEMKIATEMRDSIEKSTNMHIPDSDLSFICIHMIGFQVFDNVDENVVPSNVINTVRIILSEIRKIYSVDFFYDIDLFTVLCTHIAPMIQRIQNHVRMRNPLLPQIHEEDPIGFDMAVLASNIIQETYHASMDENEIGYLALHFQLALKRKNTPIKKNILVVCASGIGTSRLLKFNLEKQFPNQFSTIDTTSLLHISSMDLQKYDLLISTIPLENINKPVIVVKGLLDTNDSQQIAHYLQTTNEITQDILQAFHPDLFFSNMKAKNAKETIISLCSSLRNIIEIPIDFPYKVIAREKIASTYLGHSIVVPHPTESFANENKIVIAHFKKPLQWFDGNTVNWIFLLCMKKDDTNEDLVRLLYHFISSDACMIALNNDPTFSCFISNIQMLTTKKEESIFQ